MSPELRRRVATKQRPLPPQTRLSQRSQFDFFFRNKRNQRKEGAQKEGREGGRGGATFRTTEVERLKNRRRDGETRARVSSASHQSLFYSLKLASIAH